MDEHQPAEAKRESYAVEEAAKRAGVSADFLRRVVELGIIPADDDGTVSHSAVRRAGMVRSLDGAGIPLEGIAESMHRGDISLDFLDSDAYQRFAALSGETFEEVSSRTGIPMSLLAVVREAIGRAQPGPNDRIREDELTVLPFIEYQLEVGFRPKAIERLLRAQGDSLHR